jgi:hypothetical protein
MAERLHTGNSGYLTWLPQRQGKRWQNMTIRLTDAFTFMKI